MCCKYCLLKISAKCLTLHQFTGKMLSDFASCRAQCGFKGSLKEIYVPITGNFQEPLSVMSHTCYPNKIILI